MYTVGMGRSLARGWRLAVGSGWMYTLGMDVHGRDGAQSGARLAVGGCILFRSSFFFLHNNNTLQHLIMAISINTTHGSVTN